MTPKMAKVNWTDEQLNAISHKDGNMLVAAAAGSGKTAVLVERVIRLCDFTDIDKMLVVTFTNAAAANMKQGIHKAISEKLEETESLEKREHYARQLSLLPGANITTMHAFCSRFVRENFDALHLPPSITLGDVTALKVMLCEAADEAIEQSFEEGDACFLQFAKETVTKTNDGILSEMILKLHEFLMAQPDPEGFLAETHKLYEMQDAEKLLCTPALTAMVHAYSDSLLKTAKANMDLCLKMYSEYEYAADCFAQELCYAEKIIATEGNLASIEAFLDAEKLPAFRFAKKGVPTEVSDTFKEMHGRFKADLKEISDMVHTYNIPSLKEFMEMQAYQIRALCELTQKTMAIYTKKKRDVDLLDFDDLEHLSIRLLYENGDFSPLAKACAQNYAYIIVDEYQDTNLVQETILSALSCDKEKLFMVGDIKQSIYGFRNTAPDLFMDKNVRYAKKDGGEAVYLNANFRSRKCVLNFANFIFEQLMTPLCGGSPYTANEALKPLGSFPETEENCELYVLKDPFYNQNTTSSIEGEALFCAQKINEMVQNGFLVSDNAGGMRPAEYKDFAILARNMRGVAQMFYDTLTACGIPVYCDNLSESFLDSMEIQSLLAFLRAFDNPLQDIYLLSAFLSPVFGEPDYDLVVRIRSINPKKSLYWCMCQFPEAENGATQVQAFLSFLHKYRKMALDLTVSDLLSRFLTETNFNAYILSLHGGAERLSNVRYLEALAASNYPGAETGGLYAFLSYLEKHNTYKSEFSAPKILPDNANMVQLTTIHKSKGLEYPVVFLVGMGREFVKSSQERIFAHSHIGFGINYRNALKNMKFASPVVNLIKDVKNTEEKSEELRVLYVAMTRAKEKTMIVGTITEKNKRTEEYAKLAQNTPESETQLPQNTVLQAKSFLDWILYACERYQATPDYPVKRYEITKIPIPNTESIKTDALTPLPPTPEIDAAFSYVYPYEAQSKVYSKISVTELKRMMEHPESDTFYPFKGFVNKVSFEDDETALSRGTITHYLLERCDFAEQTADNTLRILLQNGEVTQEEADLADLAAVNRFLKTDLCDKIRKADFYEKELSFTIHIDSALLDSSAPGSPVQLQGTMDLIFLSDDILYVVDFKTDRITDANRAEKLKSYRQQLNFYKMGAVKLYPKHPVKGYIVFLDEENGIYEV